MDGEPFKSHEAKKLIAHILLVGTVVPTSHFKKAAADDNLTIVDAINVLQAGIVEQPEWENGAWRYRVRTHRIVVVVELASEDELVLVTTWRLKR